MQNFTPWASLAGGLLIGLSAAFYLLSAGRISGISGIVEAMLRPSLPGARIGVVYLAGLALGALAVAKVAPDLAPHIELKSSIGTLLFAGLLVGLGTRLAKGCTSGHGVCGLPRFAPRSIVSVGIFMGVAAVTVFAKRLFI